MKVVYLVMVNVCWFLEALADRLFGEQRASEFYPSARWENRLWGVTAKWRRGKTRSVPILKARRPRDGDRG